MHLSNTITQLEASVLVLVLLILRAPQALLVPFPLPVRSSSPFVSLFKDQRAVTEERETCGWSDLSYLVWPDKYNHTSKTARVTVASNLVRPASVLQASILYGDHPKAAKILLTRRM